ncbi:MAG TPA: tetratricopeptide repeat protein, partial [Treponemataceae bacterium]|nr:tetratricopeptide repeat protein [Treponemataceae bacterium]
SVHILVEIPKKIKDSFKDGDLPKNLICEIQVRTILQDAWAEVEHELVYKSSFSPFDLPLRRKLASMNASLSLADIIFQEIRDYQRKLNDELAFRRENFYLQADLLGKEKLTVENEINREMGAYKSINSPSPYVKGTIDDYLLEAIHAQNSGENELAVEIYSRIIHSQPEQSKQVLSVIYKHRGMAYFAMHNYKLAIDDFSKSVDYDKNNYRSMYYCGIVLSVINDDEKALDYFDKSLLVNPYQAHVNYRRAMSLYRLGNNTDALGALDEARRLGLDDEEAKQLHELLEKELGVKK